jgi:hypothetical protein
METNNFSSFWNTSLKISRHFIIRLRQTPLLLGWLIIGPFVALYLDSLTGLLLGLANILLIGIYAVIIRLMTSTVPPQAKINRPKLEWGIALVLFVFFLLTQLLDFGVWQAQPLYGWVRSFFSQIYTFTASVPGIPEWALMDTYLAISSTLKKLIPTILVLLILGYRPADMGFRHPHWKLTGLLVGLTTLFGLVTGVLLQKPL